MVAESEQKTISWGSALIWKNRKMSLSAPRGNRHQALSLSINIIPLFSLPFSLPALFSFCFKLLLSFNSRSCPPSPCFLHFTQSSTYLSSVSFLVFYHIFCNCLSPPFFSWPRNFLAYLFLPSCALSEHIVHLNPRASAMRSKLCSQQD